MSGRTESVDQHELAERSRAIVDANLYMVLGTADEEGRPWASPVYFAADGYRDFYWVSRPEAVHSRNIAWRVVASVRSTSENVQLS